MIFLQASILVLVGLAGTSVVFTRKPERQPIAISFYGLILTVILLGESRALNPLLRQNAPFRAAPRPPKSLSAKIFSPFSAQ
jgi:hypothetical protein